VLQARYPLGDDIGAIIADLRSKPGAALPGHSVAHTASIVATWANQLKLRRPKKGDAR
jgi:hypothetical protein